MVHLHKGWKSQGKEEHPGRRKIEHPTHVAQSMANVLGASTMSFAGQSVDGKGAPKRSPRRPGRTFLRPSMRTDYCNTPAYVQGMLSIGHLWWISAALNSAEVTMTAATLASHK